MKKILLLMLSIVISLTAMAQATTMTIDNQTPGWLSSKINYGDQQTLINLTVTGYINQTDVDFINSLISGQKLHGKLDLTDAEIIGSSRSYDNTMTGYNGEICCIKGHLSHLLLPKKLKKANSYACCYAFCDTITLGGPSMKNIEPNMFFMGANSSGASSYKSFKCLIFREGVESVGSSNDIFSLPSLKSITFPASLKKIYSRAFTSTSYNPKDSLYHVSLTDSIEEIGENAFSGVPAFRDTVRLPKRLKIYYMNSFSPFDRQVVYISDSIKEIHFNYPSNYFECHISREVPLNIGNYNTNGKVYKRIHVYVPKSALKDYENSNWSAFTLHAESNPVTNISLSDDTLSIQKGHTHTLTASIFPIDADTDTRIWHVKDENIAKVTDDGIVSALSSGTTYIYVTLKNNPALKDSCLINVFQPVISIQLRQTTKEIKVNESFELSATVLPFDADNKTVIWKSNDNNIATVENGTVRGIKAGITKITAISASDTTVCASCNVKVLQPVEGIFIDKNSCEMKGIGDTIQLTAIVSPDDASNKTVNWKSSDEKVCMVSNGKVVAVGLGTAVVIATSADGGYMATCTVTVTNTSGISDVYSDKSSQFKIYRIDGKQINKLQKGFNIIKFDNGITKRVVIND